MTAPDPATAGELRTAQLIPAGGVDRIPPFDKRTGAHFWIFPVAFAVKDPDRFFDQPHGPMLFDVENLVFAQALGCIHCEEQYSKRLASRRCRGHGGGGS